MNNLAERFARRSGIWLLALAFLLGSSSTMAQEDIAVRLANLIDQGKPEDAYVLGKNAQGSKGPEFDLWFGTAALDTGEPQEAIVLLRRFIQQYPAHVQIPRARAELGRALLVSGDGDSARAEFEAVLATKPPKDVASNVKALLTLTATPAQSKGLKMTGYIELGLGHDSNVNGGVSSSNVALPALGLVTLNTSGVKAASSFASAAAGADLAYPVSRNLAFIGSAQGDLKSHQKRDEFDLRSGTVAGGMAWSDLNRQMRAQVSYTMLDVDNKGFRQVTSLNLDGSQAITATSVIGLSAIVGEQRFEEANALRDGHMYSVGAGYQQALAGAWKPVLNLGLSYGEEQNTRSRPDLGRTIAGARAVLSLTPAVGWVLSAGGTWQASRYQGVDPLFLVTRDDTYTSVDLAASYLITPGTTLRMELMRARTDSNVELWRNDRDLIAFKVRYDFR